MIKNNLLQRTIVFAVILLFIVSSVTATLGKDTLEKTVSFVNCESIKATSSINNGSLSGYVKDSSMDPIEGARVRVHFHGTYEEDYTDSSGYYHVTNIPICYCLKNTTATKLGYKSKWVLLAIDEDTTYDFILKTANAYNGSLSGYVKDSSMDPIEGARVRVHFHGTYEENYTDSSGYYDVDNIPICYCLKNCTAYKKGYKTAWILLAIDENTTHDFVLAQNKTVIIDLKNQQSIKYFTLRFFKSYSLFEQLLLTIFNHRIFG